MNRRTQSIAKAIRNGAFMNTILLLEDEESLRRGISFKLEKEGYHVITAGSIKEARMQFDLHDIQLILCDIMLDDGSGLEFCQYIRNEKRSGVRFIFLTAMDQEVDIVMGYESGADDYITKPFSLAVLISKVNAVFKRISDPASGETVSVIKSGELLYYPNEMKLWINGEPVSLTKNEYRLLQLFLNHPKQILSKQQILEQIFDVDGIFADDNTVAVNILRLREKIGDNDEKRILKNIRGMGYVWDCITELL